MVIKMVSPARPIQPKVQDLSHSSHVWHPHFPGETYPLVNVHVTMERSTIFIYIYIMDKSTISTGPFSMSQTLSSEGSIPVSHPNRTSPWKSSFRNPHPLDKKRHLDSKAMEMDPTTDLPRSLADGLQTLAKVPLRRGLEALRLECSVDIYIYIIHIYIYGWKKSCTSWYIYICIEFTPLIYPTNYSVSTIQGGTRFLPSSLSMLRLLRLHMIIAFRMW